MDKPLSVRPQPYVQGSTTSHSVELLDQHKATTALLEPRNYDTIKHPQVFTGCDDETVRALGADSSCFGVDDSKTAGLGPREGLPPQGLLSEFLGILLSGCFLALGACVAALKDKPESAWSSRVIQATRIAPSVWPIVFSGVLGNGIRALADWQVERGVSLLSLEQLLGSLTMGGTITTALRWSILNISSAALIALWTFNPIGSQASFRGVQLRPGTNDSRGHISTYDANFSTHLMLSQYQYDSPIATSDPTSRALYASTLYDLVSGTQYVNPTNATSKEVMSKLGGDSSAGIQAASDNWGNVRIPSLTYSDGYNPNDPHKWLQTPWDKTVLNYSSLLGDRVDGVDRAFTGNTSFTIMSSFQQFNCSPWTSLNYHNQSQTYSDPPRNDSEADIWLLRNTGKNYEDLSHLNAIGKYHSLFITMRFENMTATPDVREMVFGSEYSDLHGLRTVSITTCVSKTLYVDANVTCVSKGTLGKALCGVGALRATPSPPGRLNETVLNNYPHAKNSFIDFVDLLDGDRMGMAQSSVVEYYLFDPMNAFTTQILSDGYVNLGSLDIGLFERRFSLLWNTLWKISWAAESATGGNMSARSETLQYILTNTTSNVTFPVPATYAIDKRWLTTYFISVGVMFATSIFSLVMRSRCCAPAILGYVSSLVRDSTYFHDCGVDANSTEGGPEKSKRLAKLRVMVADVGDGPDGAGKIAFAPVGMGKRVVKGRTYI